MSYFLPHLPSGWHVDEAIKSEEDRVVVIRFGHDWDSQCMKMDETLYGVSEKVQNFAVIYLVDITSVPDFNKVSDFLKYEVLNLVYWHCGGKDVWVVWPVHGDVLLPVSSSIYLRPYFLRLISIYTRNKHIMIDLGTGNNNKMWVELNYVEK